MPSDIQVTNIKANDGTAGLVIADSTGAVTGTLGSGTTFPAGHVIQVVSTHLTTAPQYAINSTTWVAGGLYVTITPSSTSSKILVHAMCSLNFDDSSVNAVGYTSIHRGSTLLTAVQSAIEQGITHHAGSSTLVYLDSPNTTSATTYQCYGKSSVASFDWRLNSNDTDTSSTITAMEISA